MFLNRSQATPRVPGSRRTPGAVSKFLFVLGLGLASFSVNAGCKKDPVAAPDDSVTPPPTAPKPNATPEPQTTLLQTLRDPALTRRDHDARGVVRELRSPQETVPWQAFHFDPRGGSVAAAPGMVFLHQEDGGRLIETATFGREVFSVRKEPRGRRVAIVAGDGGNHTLGLFDLKAGEQLGLFDAPHSETHHWAKFQQVRFVDGDLLAFGSGAVLKVISWDGKLTATIPEVSHHVLVSPHEGALLAREGEKSVQVSGPHGGWGFGSKVVPATWVDLEEYEHRSLPELPQASKDEVVYVAGVMPDFDRVLVHRYEQVTESTRDDVRTEIRSLKDGRRLAVITEPPGEPRAFSWSGDRVFYAKSSDRDVQVAAYDLNTGEELFRWSQPAPQFVRAAEHCRPRVSEIYPSEKVLGVVGVSNRSTADPACLNRGETWNLEDGSTTSMQVMKSPAKDRVAGLAFSPDGVRLAVLES